jgi:2-oxo-3-hexenedioate decarboxylase
VQKDQLQKIAEELFQARTRAQPVTQYSDRYDQFSRSDAYTIQETGINLRLGCDERIVGMKMGLTSEAKRKQMNLEAPLYGVLTDKMEVKEGEEFQMAGKIHPKIEPEVAFHFTSDLKGTVTREEVLEACDGVYAALEILDSRYEHFKYFSMEDVISDNSSSAFFILGDKISDFKEIDLANLKMEMKANGDVVQSGNSNAISGDPVVSVIQLCELLAERDQFLEAGSIVLAGAATPAVNLESGMDIELTVEKLGTINFKVGGAVRSGHDRF